MASATLSPAAREALGALAADLRRIFGNRLHTVCAYGLTTSADADLRTISLVQGLAFDDFAACVPLVRGWNKQGLAAPLILDRAEFARTLDVFPLEYGEIIANHVVILGEDPFEGISVSDADLRRGCELQATSHLIHLREGFLESRGDSRAVAALIGASAEAYARLLTNLLALVGPRTRVEDTDDLADAAATHVGVSADVTREVLAVGGSGASTIADPTALLARYVAAVEQIWAFLDAWKRS